MKSKGSAFLRFLGGFASTILSIVFVLTAFVLVLYYSIVGIFKPKTIVKIIQNIDYIEVFKQTEEFSELSAELDIDPEEFDKLMKDKAVGRLFADFAEEINDKMFDPEAKLEDIDAPVFKSLIDEHIDGILPIIEQKNAALAIVEPQTDIATEAETEPTTEPEITTEPVTE